MGNQTQKESTPKQQQPPLKKENSKTVIEEEVPSELEDSNEMVQLMKDFGRITRITRFTPKEIIYLNNRFKELSDGKKHLTFERLCEIREFVSQNKELCKKLFDIFLMLRLSKEDIQGIGLLDFLRACSIFSRGSLEEQLPFLFIAMKDENENQVTRKSALSLAQMVTDAFHNTRKISKSGEVLGEAWAKIDIVDEIDEKMFKRDDNIKLKQDEFILNALSTPSALHCLSIMERFFHPVTSEMTETNLNDLSLRFLVRLEKSQLPNSVSLVCGGIEAQLGIYEKDMKRLYVELSCRQDKQMVDALLTSFGLGFTTDIDLNELNIVCLLHLLKTVLEKFASPLFTFPISIKYTSLPINDINETCEEILKSLPEENYHTSRKVITTLHRCCFKDPKLYDALCNFFVKSFFRFPENDNNNYTRHSTKASQIFRHFIQFIPDFPQLTFGGSSKSKEGSNAPFFTKSVNPTSNQSSGTLSKSSKNKISLSKSNKSKKLTLSHHANDFEVPTTSSENEEKKNINKIPIILQFVLKYLTLNDLLKSRQVNKSWLQICSNSKHLHSFFTVDFQLLLKWRSVSSKNKLAQLFSWTLSPSSSFNKNNSNTNNNSNNNSNNKVVKEFGGFEIKEIGFQICKLSDSKQKSDEFSVRDFTIAVCGRKSSGKSALISRLGRYVDFSDIRKSSHGIILEGNTKAEPHELFFSVCLIELESVQSLFDAKFEEKSHLNACVLVSSASDNSEEQQQECLEFDNKFKQFSQENKLEIPLFHVFNKIDEISSSEQLKQFAFNFQTSGNTFSNQNYFPVSLEKEINTQYFYFTLFKSLLK